MLTSEKIFVAFFKTIMIVNAICCLTNNIESKIFSIIIIGIGIGNVLCYCILNEFQLGDKEDKK